MRTLFKRFDIAIGHAELRGAPALVALIVTGRRFCPKRHPVPRDENFASSTKEYARAFVAGVGQQVEARLESGVWCLRDFRCFGWLRGCGGGEIGEATNGKGGDEADFDRFFKFTNHLNFGFLF